MLNSTSFNSKQTRVRSFNTLIKTITMPSVNRNITLECPVCKKSMRSDNLKRHKLKKHKNFNFQVTTIVKANVKDSGNPSVQDLESEILADNKLLDEKIELGEKISKVLTNTNAKEESLSKKNKEAFNLYQSKKFAINPNDDLKLYPWQQQAIDLMQKPSLREVIWVKGARGNEGKTWFQKYVQSLLGRERVVQLDLKNSIGNIMQILRKLPLSTLDTFMFNDARSGLSETRCYDVLENLKDGCSIASKYSSEIIQFKTPNVVIVFSNADPDMTQLSKDRWKVFYINKDGLSSQEKRLWESRSSRKRSRHCRRFPLY